MSESRILEQTAPRSALRHRPIHTDGSTYEMPLMPRASRMAPNLRGAKQKRLPSLLSLPHRHGGVRWHWLFFVGIGMLLALTLVVLGHIVLSWASLTWDDLHYGRPRTYQVDAFVGHEAARVPSHFIALNLHGRIEILEFPGGDATHARIFLGPQLYGTDADLVPVRLEFIDVRHDHHPDMIVVFGENHLVFRNEQGTFQPPS